MLEVFQQIRCYIPEVLNKIKLYDMYPGNYLFLKEVGKLIFKVVPKPILKKTNKYYFRHYDWNALNYVSKF